MRAKNFFTFSRRLFLIVILLFTAFVLCFLFFQYQREKHYKSDLLNIKLQSYNDRLYDYITGQCGGNIVNLNKYISTHIVPNLRITVINDKGKVLFDNTRHDWQHMNNHFSRPEVQDALLNGVGYSVVRKSESLAGEEFFYSAKYYPEARLVIRSALPYNLNLTEHLKADHSFFWVGLLISSILIFLLYRFTRHLGMSITELQKFANRADRNEEIDMEMYKHFPNNELGEISRHIIQIYERLHKAKKELTEEHEKRIYQEEEQIRIKRQLTQNIAHELKTPVSSIQGYLETIINNPSLSDDKKQVFIEHCFAQCNRLATLLSDIAVLTRMDEAPELIEKEQIDIRNIINNILEEVAMGLEAKNIKIENQINRPLPIHGNYSLIYSIFRNLTDNAIAYAGNNICIQIKCVYEDENLYHFSFSDSGIGVSPEHLNRLFERFYRVDKGRSRKQGGTGLGLSIVKNAVLFHGGSIYANNRKDGGLEFIFTLKKQEKELL